MICFPGDLSFRDIIEEQNREISDRTFLVFVRVNGEVKTLTYGQLDRQTSAVASSMVAAGLRHGDRVLMLMANSSEFVIATLAAAKAGVVTVPINPACAPSELMYVFELVRPSGLLVDRDVLMKVEEAQLSVKSFQLLATVGGAESSRTTPYIRWNDLLQGNEAPLPTVRGNDLFQILMTSGTTGQPKAVMHTHALRLRSAYRQAMQARVSAEDRVLNPFPAFHINCLDSALLPCLVSGATAIILDRFSESRFWSIVRQESATLVCVIPTVMRAVLRQPKSEAEQDHAVRLILGALRPEREEIGSFLKRFGVPAYETGYGLTEAAMGVLQTLSGAASRYPSIGLPMIDRIVDLVDENGRSVPVGEVGEIVVKGEPGRSVMQGYWGDPEATAEALRDGWLYTGDLGWCDEQGYYYFAGRRKDMIKRSGENISASEVEAILAEHPAICDVAVVGIPDDFRDEAVKAFVVFEPGTSVTINDVRAFCAGKLSDFKIPTALEAVKSLPRGLMGKVDKKALGGRRPQETAQQEHTQS